MIGNGQRMAFASVGGSSSHDDDEEEKCKDAAAQISKDADGHVLGDVCGIGLSRDSPTITLRPQCKRALN